MIIPFDGIDISDSWVRGWRHADKTLEFQLELSIWPASAYYLPPKKNEYTCYRPGILRFNNVIDVQGLKTMRETSHTKDPDGSIDYGNIEVFEPHAEAIRIEGDFGNVEIRCASWEIDLKETKAEQDGAGQPATRSESDSEGGDKPQPESEERSR